MLADNEHFLTAKECKAVYTRKNVILEHVPARSPDLNPIEKFWGWLRRELRRRDLKDLRMKRPALGKTAYRARVRSVLRAKRTQAIASRFADNLYKVCKMVKAKRGAASGC